MKKTQVSLPADNQIKIARTFNAPRSLVWEMYTKAEHLVNWWGPTGWTLPVCELDFRVGGTWFYCMAGPEDMMSCGKAVYDEIVAPERMVVRDMFADENGVVNDEMPVSKNVYTFTEADNKTTITTITEYASKEMRDQVLEMGVEAGIDQTFDRLEDYLAQQQ